MKVIIAGSRDFIDRTTIRQCIEASGIVGQITELVHGGCRGVDSVAHDLFEGVVPIKVFPADWKKHGKAAGPIRNQQMAEYADALIAIARPKSRGTGHMVSMMKRFRKPCYVFVVDEAGGD